MEIELKIDIMELVLRIQENLKNSKIWERSTLFSNVLHLIRVRDVC
jgi:hypothetical protein